MWDRAPGLTGGYTPDVHGVRYTDTPRGLGEWSFFAAEHRHSVVIGPQGAWTLLVTGPERRKWGFYLPERGGKRKGRVRMLKRNKYFYIHGHH